MTPSKQPTKVTPEDKGQSTISQVELRLTRNQRANRLLENHLSPIPLWIVRGLLTGLLQLLPHKLTKKEIDELCRALLTTACDTVIDHDVLSSRLAYKEREEAQWKIAFHQILDELCLNEAPRYALTMLRKPPTHDARTVIIQARNLGPIEKQFPIKRRNREHAVLWVKEQWPKIVSVLTSETARPFTGACSNKCPYRTATPARGVIEKLAASGSRHVFRNAVLAYHHGTGAAEIKQILSSRNLQRQVRQSIERFSTLLSTLPR